MNIAVRYFSRSGNTKAAAEAIAAAADVKAVSVDSKDAAITEDTDLLFIGGALYAYGLDGALRSYLSSLDGSKVKKAAVFSTSWISKHAIALIKKALAEKGVETAEEALYIKSKPSEDDLKNAAAFAKKFI